MNGYIRWRISICVLMNLCLRIRGTDTWALLLHWSAKEVMFKCMNTPEVDFREHLRIFPFTVTEKGAFSAEEYRTPEQRKFEIRYMLHPDFVLTWQVD